MNSGTGEPVNFSAHLFPAAWCQAAWLPWGLILFFCIRYAPWRRLLVPGQSHVWMGSIVVLSLLWSLKAGIAPGLHLHLLGVTALTLMFGRALAMIALASVIVIITLNGSAGWDVYALNALVLAAFPVLVSHTALRLVERYLPAHFFVYIFCAAFFGAAATLLLTGGFSALLLWLADVYPAARIYNDYLQPFALLAFAEAWMNGGAITLMVVYRPHWVASFDDRRYLSKK